ncbi:ABC transporter ATP-binding protein [Oceanirhabdus sp. W0125-5]|uniref:ABC transporter ATP-binding protein n=1 Tax=Oceanirhabdus sp. W0125-5 TaxID=2999116 RepID=UPI0022F30D55|nr:ABC transporter ATP-binding protein [Oceanirhabdus sp. W0125-5]WBW95671.1 ABC transporter ATP-binding protein [Oceanirhabdus sp. W0125-5]
MSNILVEMKNLKTFFNTSEGTVKAVNDVSFNIEKGKVLGVVGESGCGKSVTSLSIMGLVPKPGGSVVGGEIIFKDKDLLKLSSDEMRTVRGNEIAMIFQEPMTSLNPVFTVGMQIAEMLKLHTDMSSDEIDKRVIELIDLVGIPRPDKVVKEYPHQLSGGMRQRVMIAMALSCNPSLLIADEPTTALDVTVQAQVLEIMKDLNKKFETAIMLITHDLGVVAEMADNVVVMYAGKVVEEGTVMEIFHNPKHPYTVGLLKSRPDLIGDDDKLSCIRGMVPSPYDMPEGCAFEPRCDKCMDICKTRMPELKVLENGSKVRCWLLDEKGGNV